MSNYIKLTYHDIVRIIEISQKEGRNKNYIRTLLIKKLETCSQGENCSFIIESFPILSASEDEPTPVIGVI